MATIPTENRTTTEFDADGNGATDPAVPRSRLRHAVTAPVRHPRPSAAGALAVVGAVAAVVLLLRRRNARRPQPRFRLFRS
ncbi:hypothetical protein [Actinoplanes sp. NPDC051851]|uniref:hypothetical protein n=1 Tax=Actinoplanes sp. NPDC051851 TaxID=3154753 RepID=UPI00341DBF09